jgi:hypothetical protein
VRRFTLYGDEDASISIHIAVGELHAPVNNVQIECVQTEEGIAVEVAAGSLLSKEDRM